MLKRVWLPLLMVAAVTIGTDTAENFNPKIVTYEVFGTGVTAVINYTDLDGLPQKTGEVTLPWSLTLETTIPSVMPNLLAQSDGQSISCRVTVDDEVKDERTAEGVNAATYCLVKAA
jgi:hypothetical protein